MFKKYAINGKKINAYTMYNELRKAKENLYVPFSESLL
tara:strand:- start:75 stop:188 length:114 start_codon:yes stop_codon:yes gene_type:complete